MPHLTVRLPAEDLALLRATAELRRVPVSRLVRWGVRRVTTETLAEAAGRNRPLPVGEVLAEGHKPSEGVPTEVPAAELRPDESPQTGDELRAWREARGWTQAKLASALGVSRRTVISSERRETQPLTATVLRRLAELAPGVPES